MTKTRMCRTYVTATPDKKTSRLFLDVAEELRRLQEQIDSGQDDGSAEAHIGALALMLQSSGVEKTIRNEWDQMHLANS